MLLPEGQKVIWAFDDVGAELEIKVTKVVPDLSIFFDWGASGKQTIVNILIKSKGDDLSSIRIVEKEFEISAEDVQRAMLQTQGWTDFICEEAICEGALRRFG